MKRAPLRLAAAFAALFAAWGSAATAQADAVDALYAQGMQHYYAGRYAQATALLERVVATPLHHEDVFYNLGCAYFRQNKLGPAIFNFERAVAGDSAREDAQFNLQTARARAASAGRDVLKGVRNEPLWASWIDTLSLPGWTALFVVLWWSFFAALMALRWVAAGPLRSALIALVVLVGLAGGGSGLALAARTALAQRSIAIVLPERLAVHEGPSAHARATFRVHAGLKVEVRGEQAGWVRILLQNGLEGWVQRTSLGLL